MPALKGLFNYRCQVSELFQECGRITQLSRMSLTGSIDMRDNSLAFGQGCKNEPYRLANGA